MAAPKPKTGSKSVVPQLSGYKFDASEYIVLDGAVRRDAGTGRLIETHSSSEKPKK